MSERLQRLLSSIANQHNISLVVLIALCVAISILPFYSPTSNSPRSSSSDVFAVVSIDVTNYHRLRENYEKLNAAYNELRAQVASLGSSKQTNPSREPTSSHLLTESVEQRVTNLISEQHELRHTLEQIQQQRAATPVPKPLFQDQRVITDLYMKLHSTETNINDTIARLDAVRPIHSQIWSLAKKLNSVLVQQDRQQRISMAAAAAAATAAKIKRPIIDHGRLKQLVYDEIQHKVSQIIIPETKPAAECPPATLAAPTEPNSVDITEFDYALATAGASPIADLTSPTFIGLPPELKSTAMSVLGLSRLLDWSGGMNVGENLLGSPWDALNTIAAPGSCWPMQGHHGNLTIQLAHPVRMAAVTIDHISRDKASTDARSAPKGFAVHIAATRGSDWRVIFKGEYDLFSTETQTFHFPVAPAAEVVRLEILNNHGHPDYTCLYRLRVHGQL